MAIELAYDHTDGFLRVVSEKAKFRPLVDKVSVGVDDVWFGKLFFDEVDDGVHLMLACVGCEGEA